MTPRFPIQRTQRDRFVETAPAPDAYENEAAFNAKLAAITRQKPKEDALHPTKPEEP